MTGHFEEPSAMTDIDIDVPAAGEPLEKRLARGIDVDRGAFRPDVQDERQIGSRRIDVRPLAAGFAHAVADGILDAQGREVEAA